MGAGDHYRVSRGVSCALALHRISRQLSRKVNITILENKDLPPNASTTVCRRALTAIASLFEEQLGVSFPYTLPVTSSKDISCMRVTSKSSWKKGATRRFLSGEYSLIHTCSRLSRNLASGNTNPGRRPRVFSRSRSRIY